MTILLKSNYITNMKEQSFSCEAFIRLSYKPGEVCEFDWGEIKFNIDGELMKLQLAVFTSDYSNHPYEFIYHHIHLPLWSRMCDIL